MNKEEALEDGATTTRAKSTATAACTMDVDEKV